MVKIGTVVLNVEVAAEKFAPPVTTSWPVVVAVPYMVRPPEVLPLPIVEEAIAVMPPVNWVRVEVEFPVPVNG